MKTPRMTLAFALTLFAPHAFGFSQDSPATPIGHEWLTKEGAALAVQRHKIQLPEKAAWSAAMGQRWVDIMGFRVGVGGVWKDQTKCFDAVAQNPDNVQYDHFLRKSDEVGQPGRLAAIQGSIGRMKSLFIEAVRAGDEKMDFVDGGFTQTPYTGDKGAITSFFLLGRVAHALQDSFSPEHTIRDKRLKSIVDVKSYICTPGSEQHRHKPPMNSQHGDVIWTKTPYEKTANLKDYALAALNATAALFRAFVEARALKAEGRKEADWAKPINDLVAEWFRYDPKLQPASSNHQVTAEEAKACDKLKLGRLLQNGTNDMIWVESRRQQCLGALSDDTKTFLRRPEPTYYWQKFVLPTIRSKEPIPDPIDLGEALGAMEENAASK
jgi:hypothetical protein